MACVSVLVRILFLTSINVCVYIHTVCERESVFLTDDYRIYEHRDCVYTYACRQL